MARDERGQTLPLLALVIVIAGGSVVGLARIGEAAILRARAQTAADAAALAGAVDGKIAAARLAATNGGRLVSFRTEGREAAVVVSVGRARARARARAEGDAPDRSGSLPPGSSTGLAPAMRAALARAHQLLGRPVPITSGFRSRAKQEELWRRRASNRYPVAPPGSSMHERGLAVDVPSGFVATLRAIAGEAGLCQPYPRTDPVHFEVCRRAA